MPDYEKMTDQELDDATARRVMGWKWCEKLLCWHPDDPSATLAQSRSRREWRPSTDISAAWSVVEKMGETLSVQIDNVGWGIKPYRALIGWGDDPVCVTAEAETAPRAIVIAALRALDAQAGAS